MLKSANLALHFVLEICALAALVDWGFETSVTLAGKLLLGVVLPTAAAAAWGTFRVPGDPGSAPVAIPGVLRLLLELAFFGGAAAGLAGAGHTTLTWVFGIVTLINYALMYERIRWLLSKNPSSAR